jgi:leader peptidase (prepilin peptidase) / N-methyltransferase
MSIQDWAILLALLMTGCGIGSVLNILIYRLPRDISLIAPSACPACAKAVRLLDHVGLLFWPKLKGKCRNCRASVSTSSMAIEVFTGAAFASLFFCYFHTNCIQEMPGLLNMGWLIYLVHIILLCVLIVSTVIDLEFWIIPLSICWFVTGAAIIGIPVAAAGVATQGPIPSLIPTANPVTGALALGSMLGLALSLGLLATGKIKRSYESDQATASSPGTPPESGPFADDGQFNHRQEMCRELVFLAPAVALALAMVWLTQSVAPVAAWWDSLLTQPLASGALGSAWGYVIGCAVIWGIRIMGTLGFGREAMGLGDVHLMGAVGAVIGPTLVSVAIFVACIYGAVLEMVLLLFKRNRAFPFGPYLAIGTVTVMILRDWFMIKAVDVIAAWSILLGGQIP